MNRGHTHVTSQGQGLWGGSETGKVRSSVTSSLVTGVALGGKVGRVAWGKPKGGSWHVMGRFGQTADEPA